MGNELTFQRRLVARLDAWRKSEAVSVDEIAARLGVKYTQVRGWLYAGKSPGGRHIDEIAILIGLRLPA